MWRDCDGRNDRVQKESARVALAVSGSHFDRAGLDDLDEARHDFQIELAPGVVPPLPCIAMRSYIDLRCDGAYHDDILPGG